MSGDGVLRIAAIWILLCLSEAGLCARVLTDSSGSKIELPEIVQRAWGTSPPVTALIYAIDPELLIGVNLPFSKEDEPFVAPAALTLPVLGGWTGHGQTPNLEAIFKLAPQLAVLWDDGILDLSVPKKQLALARVATATVKLNHLEDYPAALRFLGKLLKREDRAETLAQYVEKTLSSLRQLRSRISPSNSVPVYYAEGAAGLNTECDESFHVETILLAGGRNVYHCKPQSHFGMEQASLEQVVVWNPAAILVQEPVFYRRVFDDAHWKMLTALQKKQVFLIPRRPFNWVDRPPSFMRALGAQWLANLLYPELYPLDLAAATREFYKLFLRVDLDESRLKQVLSGSAQ